MRELKFRAWNPNANRFDSYAGVRNMSLGEAGALWAKGIPMEFQQYTGLKDKNGVEIYEGDIIVVHDVTGDYPPEMVVFDRCSFYLGRDLLGAHTYGTLEVIGNIYKNPELLEGQNE